MLVTTAYAAWAQVYQLGPQGAQRASGQAGEARHAKPSLGWGSNIENARLVHSAQQALLRGDRVQALGYARRAADAAPNDPQIWFLLGYTARLNGAFALSVDAYNHGLRLSPHAVDGLSGLAQDYALTGRVADAESLLTQAAAANPGRPDDLALLGELYMKSEDYPNAIRWLSEAERIRESARFEVLLATCYQHLKQMSLASHYLAMAEHRAPGNVDVERSLAGYYNQVGEHSEAIAALKAIRNPSPQVVAELAYSYQRNGQAGQSARLYAQAATAAPADLDMQLAAAQAEFAAGSMIKAELFADRAKKLNPGYYRLHAIQGDIEQSEEQNQDAVRDYQLALSNLPLHPIEGQLYGIQLHMDLVALYDRLGNTGSAQRELQLAESEMKGVHAGETDREGYLRLKALIEMNAGDLTAALADIGGALSLGSGDPGNLQLDGDVLMKLGRTVQAIAVYRKVLAVHPDDRSALTSLGYASRAIGRYDDARRYFLRLQSADPSSYTPYLALGDLYTAHKDYRSAQLSYNKGYSVAPQNPLIVAGGINAGVEAHNMALARQWMSRVSPSMSNNPFVLREEERYLSFDGQYLQSAEKGERAIRLLPRDRDVVVYLGYDLLHLERYSQLLSLTHQYMNILSKEPDIPLLQGYVYIHDHDDAKALADFTEVLRRDPEVVTAYVNRGYVLSDLHRPKEAAADFMTAIGFDPGDGEAHLGLAYADLDLRRPSAALREAQLAQRTEGDTRDIHVIRATAYGREGMLTQAVAEYRAALKFTPKDGSLYLGLGNALFSEHEYRRAISELQIADNLAPANAETDALLARAYGAIHDRAQTLHHVQLAENELRAVPHHEDSGDRASAIFVSTGEALSSINDTRGAMQRFREALNATNGNRIAVRLAIAQLMAQRGQSQAAEREIALAWLEAEAGNTSAPTGMQYLAAADVLRSLHEYALSQSYLSRASAAGAPEGQVRIGLAENELALGETARAQTALSAIEPDPGDPSYQYLMAQANVYRQEHMNGKALTAFAQAANATGTNETAVENMLAAGADEGLRLTSSLSALSDFSVEPIFEDTTVYVLDSKLDGAAPVPSSNASELPPPRSSIQTEWTDAFHLQFGRMPPASGFFQLRNARGLISVPSTNSIVDRDTTDSTFNFGLNPTVHLGNNILTFNSGVQATIRRDSNDPYDMNQNLIRVFAYMTTSSFFNALSVNGYVLRESGPFTESNLHSHALSGALNFRVGAPWGKTALLTGWGVNDQVFSPAHIEDYYTSSYVGLDRRFSGRLDLRGVVEDLRAWRVFVTRGGIAQDLRTAVNADVALRPNWDMQLSTAYSNTRGFHVYDALENGISISYSRPFRHMFQADSGSVPVQYPIRFSAGWRQESFFNFQGPQSEQYRPYVEISIF